MHQELEYDLTLNEIYSLRTWILILAGLSIRSNWIYWTNIVLTQLFVQMFTKILCQCRYHLNIKDNTGGTTKSSEEI